jgi:hypothetical protein
MGVLLLDFVAFMGDFGDLGFMVRQFFSKMPDIFAGTSDDPVEVMMRSVMGSAGVLRLGKWGKMHISRWYSAGSMVMILLFKGNLRTLLACSGGRLVGVLVFVQNLLRFLWGVLAHRFAFAHDVLPADG